jgi:hypothetical protein
MDLYQYLRQLQPNEVLITSNQRLSRFLKDQYYQQQRHNNPAFWTATILPYQAWLESLWYQNPQLQRGYYLLNEHQALILWQQCVKESQHELLQLKATAKLAQSAWRLIQQWQLPQKQNGFKNSEDEFEVDFIDEEDGSARIDLSFKTDVAAEIFRAACARAKMSQEDYLRTLFLSD